MVVGTLSKYEAEYGPGDCTGQSKGMTSTTCTWADALDVKLTMHKLEDSERGGIDLSLSQPAE